MIRPLTFISLLLTLILSDLRAQNRSALLESFDKSEIKFFKVDDKQRSTVVTSVEGYTRKYAVHIFTDVRSGQYLKMNTQNNLDARTYTECFFIDGQTYLLGEDNFQCDIFETRPFLTVVTPSSSETFDFFDLELESYQPTFDDNPNFKYVMHDDKIYAFSNKEYFIIDKQGNIIENAQDHPYQDMVAIYETELGILIIRTEGYVIINGAGAELVQSDMYLGEILTQNKRSLISLLNGELIRISTTDLQLLPIAISPGEILDINSNTIGIAVLYNDNDEKKAIAYNYDGEVIDQSITEIDGRWDMSKVALIYDALYAGGPAISARPNSTIVHPVNQPLDQLMGPDIAISNAEFIRTGMFSMDYSYELTNLSTDTVVDLSVLSGSFGWSACTSQGLRSRLHERILFPMESITISSSFSSLIGRNQICIYARSPNNLLDPDISNNSACAQVIVSTHNPIANNIKAYRSGDRTITIQLNDVEHTQSTTLQLYNALGQLISQRKITAQEQLVELADQPSGMLLYRITDQRGLIKSGSIWME